MVMPDFLSKSVTSEDVGRVTGDSGVLRLIIPQTWTNASNIPIPPQPPPYWTPDRDEVLRATMNAESMWGASIGIAITKIASKSWQIETNQPRKAERFQKLFLYADTAQVGWVQFISKHLRDYLTTDNGSFVEIVRQSKSVGSQIVGLRHLDSRRCIRTGDPEYPVVYRDRKNKMHKLRFYQVMMFSDMADPSEMYYGVGFSAASRAYNAIYKLSAIEWYLREKVAGLRPLALYIVNGLLQQQLEGAINTAREQTIAKGVAAYMGAVIIGVPGDKAPDVATIPLAELPDRFNRKEEFDIALLTYANSIGLDPQDLQPLSGQGLGTGTQSEILHSKAAGRGLSSWLQQWTHQVNELVLPAKTKWAWIEKDIRDMADQADYDGKRITNMKNAIEGGIVMPEQAVQVLVDQDVLPQEFLAEDATDSIAVSDSDKPMGKPEEQPVTEELGPDGEADVDAADQFAADQMSEIPDVGGEETKEAEWTDLDFAAAQEAGAKSARRIMVEQAVKERINRVRLHGRIARYERKSDGKPERKQRRRNG